jgi:hypothetical protein
MVRQEDWGATDHRGKETDFEKTLISRGTTERIGEEAKQCESCDDSRAGVKPSDA